MSQTTTPVTLPAQSPTTLLQPVSAMLRNCLIVNNPKLKQLDFTHLQMYIPILGETEETFNGQVLVKQQSDVRYRLESKQVFTYTRVDADEGLSLLGLSARTFSKTQYNEVSAYLTSIGELSITSGNINEETGDLICSFEFGRRNKTSTVARFVDLASDTFNKQDLEVVFKGRVTFTFKGKAQAVEVVETPTTTGEPAIDISSFFLHKNLGNIFRAR